MYVIIAGGGKVGSRLADLLSKEKHEVVIIEKDVKRATKLAELEALVLNGDATDESLLEEAGIKKADCLVATTRDDKVNLLVCEKAKKAGVNTIIARVSEPENHEFFVQLGVIPINVTSEVLSRIYNAISGVRKEILLSLCGDRLYISRVLITKDSPSLGKQLGKLDFKKRIIALERNRASIPLEDREVLLEGDILYLVIPAEEIGWIFNKLVK